MDDGMSASIIRTNVMALNAHRNLGLVGNEQALASVRLSSGLRINSAADDAAGLAISEGMRAQIRGLNQGGRNAQDGISVIQTAEGYMQTITEMTQRMRELVVQRLNDTYNEDQRANTNNEISQLNEEIVRIWETATFNRTFLFGRGDFDSGGGNGGSEGPGGPGGPGNGGGNGGGPGGITPPTTGDIGLDFDFLNSTTWQGNMVHASYFVPQVESAIASSGWRLADGVNVYPIIYQGVNDAINAATGYPDTPTSTQWIRDAINNQNVSYYYIQYALGTSTLTHDERVLLINAISTVINDALAAHMEGNDPWFVREANTGRMFSGYSGYASDANDPLFTRRVALQTGPDFPHSLTIDVRELVANIQNLLDEGPAFELAEIDALMQEINPLRTAFGAYQTRLEFTIENQDIAAENLSASESRIRDADMAREMMRLAQADILQQTGIAILAQANQASQSVLDLLGDIGAAAPGLP
jgi:flagellin